MTNLEDKNFNENVLHKIKEEKLLPKPKWQFLLKNSIIWILGIFSLILGATATSLIFYMVRNEDAGIYSRAGGNPLEFLLVIVPLFWIICLFVFAVLVYFYIKHTKKGYKYSAKQIILVIIGASLLLGLAANAFGFDRLIDDTLGERAPFYDRVINPQLNYWSNPDNGRLTGMIIAEQSPIEYSLVDRGGEVWVTVLAPDDDHNTKMIVGHPVRLSGQKIADHKFIIKEVMSVGPGRGFLKRQSPPTGLPRARDQSGTNHNRCILPPIIISN